MKKFICTALCSLIALSAVSLAACSDNSDSGLINLADCEIGYELPVYPDCEFDYKIEDDCVVHIREIKAVLTAKNEINESDVIEDDYYYPYTITVYVNGTTSESLISKPLYLCVACPPSNGAYGISSQSDTNGNIEWTITVKSFAVNCYVQFYSLEY